MAVEQDRDELVSNLERAVNKGNAAALVSFLVFDAVADVKFRSGQTGRPSKAVAAFEGILILADM